MLIKNVVVHTEVTAGDGFKSHARLERVTDIGQDWCQTGILCISNGVSK